MIAFQERCRIVNQPTLLVRVRWELRKTVYVSCPCRHPKTATLSTDEDA